MLARKTVSGGIGSAPKRPQDALRIFREALICDPTNAEAHHNLGLVLKPWEQHADA